MSSHLGRYIAERRSCIRLQESALARLCGWSNVSKGVRRLQELEEHGTVAHPSHLQHVVEVLQLDPAEVQRCIEHDKEERKQAFEAWASEPVEPQLLVKVAGCIWASRKIPDDIRASEAAMTELARTYAKDWNLLTCLVIDRRRCIYVRPGGVETYSVVASAERSCIGPSMRIGRQRVQSLFSAST